MKKQPTVGFYLCSYFGPSLPNQVDNLTDKNILVLSAPTFPANNVPIIEDSAAKCTNNMHEGCNLQGIEAGAPEDNDDDLTSGVYLLKLFQ